MTDLADLLVGAARQAFTNPEFAAKLRQFAQANPHGVRISSLDRDVQQQQRLWDEALKKYGSPEMARKWVAPPGSSNHNKGNAADLKYLTPEAKDWAHANANTYGLHFPLSNEDWHIEPVGSRDGKPAAPMTLPPEAATAGAPPEVTGQTGGGMSDLARMMMMRRGSDSDGLASALANLGNVKPRQQAPVQAQDMTPQQDYGQMMMQLLPQQGQAPNFPMQNAPYNPASMPLSDLLMKI